MKSIYLITILLIILIVKCVFATNENLLISISPANAKTIPSEYLTEEECPIYPKVFTLKKRNIFWNESKKQKQRRLHNLYKHKPHKRSDFAKKEATKCTNECIQQCKNKNAAILGYNNCVNNSCKCPVKKETKPTTNTKTSNIPSPVTTKAKPNQSKNSTKDVIKPISKSNSEKAINNVPKKTNSKQDNEEEENTNSFGLSLMIFLSFVSFAASLVLILLLAFKHNSKANIKYSIDVNDKYTQLKCENLLNNYEELEPDVINEDYPDNELGLYDF